VRWRGGASWLAFKTKGREKRRPGSQGAVVLGPPTLVLGRVVSDGAGDYRQRSGHKRSRHMAALRLLVVTVLGAVGTVKPGTTKKMERVMPPVLKVPSEQFTETVACSPVAAIVQL
jgi:hypothetical protein